MKSCLIFQREQRHRELGGTFSLRWPSCQSWIFTSWTPGWAPSLLCPAGWVLTAEWGFQEASAMYTFCFELGFISPPTHWVLGAVCGVIKIYMILSLLLQMMYLQKPGMYTRSRSSLDKAGGTCHLLPRMQMVIRVTVVQSNRGGSGIAAWAQRCIDPRRMMKG